MTIKAYGYLRVSGKGQVEGDGFPRQRAGIEEYAAANGVEVVDWFTEKAVKGATEWDARPAWVAMLNRIVSNGVRTIIIERLDRLARDLMVQEHIIADLKGRGIDLISTVEPDLGSDEPTRILMRQIMGAIAQYDKAMIVLKLRDSRRRARERDGRCEGSKPYGEKPGEEDVLVEIYEMARSGMTPTAIARSLNERGVKPRSGKMWYPYVVSRMVEVMPCIACGPASAGDVE